jgi:hypothetical protein
MLLTTTKTLIEKRASHVARMEWDKWIQSCSSATWRTERDYLENPGPVWIIIIILKLIIWYFPKINLVRNSKPWAWSPLTPYKRLGHGHKHEHKHKHKLKHKHKHYKHDTVVSSLQNASAVVSVGTQLMDKKLLCFGAVRPTYGVVLSMVPGGRGTSYLRLFENSYLPWSTLHDHTV